MAIEVKLAVPLQASETVVAKAEPALQTQVAETKATLPVQASQACETAILCTQSSLEAQVAELPPLLVQLAQAPETMAPESEPFWQAQALQSKQSAQQAWQTQNSSAQQAEQQPQHEAQHAKLTEQTQHEAQHAEPGQHMQHEAQHANLTEQSQHEAQHAEPSQHRQQHATPGNCSQQSGPSSEPVDGQEVASCSGIVNGTCAVSSRDKAQQHLEAAGPLPWQQSSEAEIAASVTPQT